MFSALPAQPFRGGRERLQRRYRLVYQRPQPGERHRPDQRRRSEDAGLHRLKPPHRMMRLGFDLEVKRRLSPISRAWTKSSGSAPVSATCFAAR